MKHIQASPQNKKNHDINKSGFTLIELLVVIAIIAILAAILFPVFGRARENARRSACQSNLKQWGLAMMQYKQDYDENMLMSNPNDSNYYWPRVIQPYVKNTQIGRCPSSADAQTVWAPFSGGLSYYLLYGSFSLANTGTTPATIRMTKDSDVEWPSEYVILGDGRDKKQANGSVIGSPHTDPDREDDPAGVDGSATGTGRFWYNHFEGSNFLYYDGHVKLAKIGTIKTRNLTRNSQCSVAQPWGVGGPYG